MKVFADENMFESIFRNLMSKALKYTPIGGRFTVTAKKNSNRSVEISVCDTGIGMNEKLIEYLFRLDNQLNRKGTEGDYSSVLGLIIYRVLSKSKEEQYRLKVQRKKAVLFGLHFPGKVKSLFKIPFTLFMGRPMIVPMD